MAERYSREAEMAVLGTCLAFEQEHVAEALSKIYTPEAFYVKSHRKIFRVIQELYDSDEEVDTVTVAEELEDRDELGEIGGASSIAELVHNTPGDTGLDNWCEIVNDKYERRQLEKLLKEIDPFDSSFDPSELKNIMVTRINELDDIESAMNISRLTEGSEKLIDFIQKAEEDGIPPGHLKTGMPQLTDAINYISPNDFIIIVAESGVGKTTFSFQMADFVSHKHGPVMVYTGEMMDYEIALKMHAKRNRIEMDDMIEGNMNDEKWDQVVNTHCQFEEQDLFIVTEERPTIHNFTTACRNMVEEHDIQMVVLDYLQFIKNHDPKNFQGDDFYNYVSSIINDFTKNFGVPVIAISRTNRDGKAYGSGQFDYDCNYMIRIDKKLDEDRRTGKEVDNGKRIIDVEKARLSKGGAFPMIFEQEHSRFRKPQKGDDF